jgi:hypothetical protein
LLFHESWLDSQDICIVRHHSDNWSQLNMPQSKRKA